MTMPDAASTAAAMPAIAPSNGEPHHSAVSWAAIFAGATAAAALSLILLMLGVGLGLSSASPWAQEGVSAETFGISSILWLTLTQLVAAGLGGYLAGRLRAQWLGTPADEVYFRDTAHGFLSWAIATLATAALLTSSIGTIVDRGVGAATDVAAAGTAAAAAASQDANHGHESDVNASNMGGIDYYVDRLFRQDVNGPSDLDSYTLSNQDRSHTAAESTRIIVQALAAGQLASQDTQYLGKLVAQRTGLSQQQAEERVAEVFAETQESLNAAESKAREAADEARKASIYATLWMFIALLIGAFVASLAATWGGRQRDAVEVPIR